MNNKIKTLKTLKKFQARLTEGALGLGVPCWSVPA